MQLKIALNLKLNQCINFSLKLIIKLLYLRYKESGSATTPINIPSHTAVDNCKGCRIDTCNENVINSQLYSLKFHCNGIGNVVSIRYYQNTNKCNGNNLFLSLPITVTDESVIGFQCDLSDYMTTNIHNTCGTSNYIQLEMYENDCSIDTTECNEHRTHYIITGHYFKDTNNNCCVYECSNNDNYTENGYFAIKYPESDGYKLKTLQVMK